MLDIGVTLYIGKMHEGRILIFKIQIKEKNGAQPSAV